MATAPSPNDLTRQQLDELDALLQKMLMVPLSPVETPSPTATLPPIAQPPSPPSWRVDPPASAPSLAHLTPSEPLPALRPEPPASVAPTPTAKAPVAKPPAPVPVPVPVPVPKPPTPVAKAPHVPAPVAKAPPAPAPKPVTPAPIAPVSNVPYVPLPAIPFVALNGLFDSICGAFGLPGRVLCSGFFKNIYGFAGFGLVVYTGLHVAQVQGWLTLPLQLPWPK